MNQQDQKQANTHTRTHAHTHTHTQTFTALYLLLSLSIPLPPLCCHGNRSRAVSCGSFQVKHTSWHKHTHTHTHEHTDTPRLMLFDRGLAAVKLIKDVLNLYCVGNTQPKSLCYLHMFLSTFQRPLSPLTMYKLFYCSSCQYINSLLYIR